MTGDDASAVEVADTRLEVTVEAVLGADESRDRTLVRDALERFVVDGVVTWSAADQAVPQVTRAASTAEERTNVASFELAKVRDDAEGVEELATVGARLDAFESDLAETEPPVDWRELQVTLERSRPEDATA